MNYNEKQLLTILKNILQVLNSSRPVSLIRD